MRISDWSSDVCSSDLRLHFARQDRCRAGGRSMLQNARPRRSVLYVPGSNARAIEKSKTLAADALIFDLEDAVAPDAKRDARIQACSAVKAGGFGRREVIIRVNGLNTPWGYARSEEHTSELQSLMHITYAVFCL